jgi:hypothetical protein
MNTSLTKVGLAIAWCLMADVGQAQYLYTYVTPQIQTIESKTFNRFEKSYTDFYRNDLTSDSFTSSPGIGLSAGVGFIGDSGLVLFDVSRSGSTQTAAFTSGAERTFEFRSTMWSINYGLPLGGLDSDIPFMVIPEFGYGIGTVRIAARNRNGGTPDDALNLDGTYSTFHGNMMAGISAHYVFEAVALRAGVRFNWNFLATDLSDDSKEYDYSKLPLNLGAASLGQLTDGVKDDFDFVQFSIGVAWVLD